MIQKLSFVRYPWKTIALYILNNCFLNASRNFKCITLLLNHIVNPSQCDMFRTIKMTNCHHNNLSNSRFKVQPPLIKLPWKNLLITYSKQLKPTGKVSTKNQNVEAAHFNNLNNFERQQSTSLQKYINDFTHYSS